MNKEDCLNLLSFLFILLLITCSTSKNNSPITENEYAIYAEVIDSLYITPERPVVLVGEKTETYPDDPQALTLESQFSLPETYNWDEILQSYRQNNGDQFNIDPQKIELPIIRIPVTHQNMFEQLNSQLQGLDRNQTMNYRYKLGIYWFSRVGFNTEQTQALVFTDFLCGARCGWPAYFLLEKTNGSWKIVQEYQLGRY